ncbi:rho gtpase activation protein [Anaeramoeba flamelloides]|uniref:Rho gtpase activation protein n=1 Tax=Anaeramoeba flamelloides TaxID=1746091 RepID=A0AAV7Z7N0_9EUKA|nr:rho gtpase activation protein [Anaeramoeba flamelloides]
MTDTIWYELYDVNYKQVYYYNPDTEDTQWKKPNTIDHLISVVNESRNNNKPNALEIIQDFESKVWRIIEKPKDQIETNIQNETNPNQEPEPVYEKENEQEQEQEQQEQINEQQEQINEQQEQIIDQQEQTNEQQEQINEQQQLNEQEQINEQQEQFIEQQEQIIEQEQYLEYNTNILKDDIIEGYQQDVPKILQFLYKQMLSFGLTAPGILAIDGESNTVLDRKEQLKVGDLNWNASDITIVNTLFFDWLENNKVQNPIIPDEFYDGCLNSLENEQALLEYIMTLPSPNLKTLAYLIQLIQSFLEEEVVKSTNLGIEELVAFFNTYIFSINKTSQNPELEQFFLETIIFIVDPTQFLI